MLDLKQRTKEFALRIIRLYSRLPDCAEAQVIGRQVLRQGPRLAHIIAKPLELDRQLNS